MKKECVFANDEERWAALVRRDRRAVCEFFYAVKSTGIFCRPTCPSRRPRRANVRFFETAEQAMKEGFRACKKCRPDAPSANHVPETVIKACHLIDNAAEPPSLEELANAVGLSASYFHRVFKKFVGVTPKAYASARRAERFRTGLHGDKSVTEAMYDAGYGASSRCYEETGRQLGMTPTQYRHGGIGQTIHFAVAECYLGWVAVAATERGVCSIAFGDTPAKLREDLADRFPRAELRERESELSEWLEQVVAYIDAPQGELDLPLDIQGTAFQRRVWEVLRDIPSGTTVTYAEVARRLGQPAASRAVAGACAANKLAMAIPCHRVVRKGGDLSGYRWGRERKRRLLEREASVDDQVNT